MDVVASRRTTSITTGLTFAADGAPVAGDLHVPALAFAPVHRLQPAGSLSGTESALCGALLLGAVDADAQRPRPSARFFHAPPLVEWSRSFSAATFFSPSDARPHCSLDRASGSGRSRNRAFVLGDASSTNSLASTPLRTFTRPPSLPGNAGQRSSNVRLRR
jgi:hypothetical protein